MINNVMLNKTNILVIFILFTIGCVSLPETTAENIQESPTPTIDIDATVMAEYRSSLPTRTSLPYPTPTSTPKSSPLFSRDSTELLGGCDSPRLSLNVPSIILESETACRSIDSLSYRKRKKDGTLRGRLGQIVGEPVNTGVVLEWDVKTKTVGWLSSFSVDYYIIGMILNIVIFV